LFPLFKSYVPFPDGKPMTSLPLLPPALPAVSFIRAFFSSSLVSC
jgi:hypothetical protein